MTLLLISIAFISFSLWITWEVFFFFCKDWVLYKIELWEAEAELHQIKRKRIIQRNRKQRNQEVPEIQVEEVPPTETPQVWQDVFYKTRSDGRKVYDKEKSTSLIIKI